nr:hypothetical protein [Amoebophilaceae bacterium]
MSTSRKNLSSGPNTQSWAIVILLIIISTTLYLNRMNTMISISEHKFETMMLKGDVNEVVLVINKN